MSRPFPTGNTLLLTVHAAFRAAVEECMAADAAQAAAREAEAAAKLELEALRLKAVAAEKEPEAEDITDPAHYSIQQEKIQAAEDRRLAEAQRQKDAVKAQVEDLRTRFEALLAENAALPPGEQLAEEELEIDPELRVILEREAAEKVDEARRELAWESEYKAVALRKLKEAFLDDIAVERIELACFRTPHTVASFRTRKLTAEQRENIDAVHTLIAAEEANRKGKDAGGAGGEAAKGGAGRSGAADAGGAEGEAGEERADQTAEELEAQVPLSSLGAHGARSVQCSGEPVGHGGGELARDQPFLKINT
jgi:hypothetical protein